MNANAGSCIIKISSLFDVEISVYRTLKTVNVDRREMVHI